MDDERPHQQESGKSLSFSFSKRVASKKLEDSKLREDSTKDHTQETDFVRSFEHNQINSTIKKEEKKELIIPLIEKNQWRYQGPDGDVNGSAPGSPRANRLPDVDSAKTLEERAALELLRDCSLAAEDWEGRGDKKQARVIPMVMMNKIPEGFETEEKIDASLRAEESTLDDYEKVPVDEYGYAMLKGMGWKPGTGIGKSNQKATAPIQVVVRPKGLGLGADRRVLQGKGQQGASKDPEEDMTLKPDAYILVTDGPYVGSYAKVVALDEDNARCEIQLALASSGNTMTISNYRVQVVPKKEFQDKSRVINRDKYEEYKEKEREKNSKEEADRKKREEKRRKDRSRSRSPKRKRDRSRSPKRKKERSRSPKRKKDKKREKEEKKREKEEKKREKEDKRISIWVHPQLRVRCIDRKYRDGRYFGTKMVVIDVVSSDSCTCRSEDGHLLDLHPEVLETVIPKTNPSYVMVVSGRYRGQLGEVVNRDKSKCVADIQLLPDRDEVVRLEYDDVCEYAGDLSHM